MDEMLRQLRVAHRAGAELPALMGLLAIPDMCAALGSDNRRTSGAKYRAWVMDNLPSWDTQTSADALWDFRCSLLHQGSIRGQKPGLGTPELRFVPANDRHIGVHNLSLVREDGGQIAVIDVGHFADEVITAASAWCEARKDTDRYQRNYEHFVQYRPDGLLPWLDLGGVPVIG